MLLWLPILYSSSVKKLPFTTWKLVESSDNNQKLKNTQIYSNFTRAKQIFQTATTWHVETNRKSNSSKKQSSKTSHRTSKCVKRVRHYVDMLKYSRKCMWRVLVCMIARTMVSDEHAVWLPSSYSNIVRRRRLHNNNNKKCCDQQTHTYTHTHIFIPINCSTSSFPDVWKVDHCLRLSDVDSINVEPSIFSFSVTVQQAVDLTSGNRQNVTNLLTWI